MLFSRPGPRRFQLKYTFSVICFRRRIGVLLSLLFTFLELRTRLLMLSLVSVQAVGCRGSCFPLPNSSAPAGQLLKYLLPKTTVLAFLGPGYGSFHFLPSSWKAPPQWLALACRRVDTMFVCFIYCRFKSVFVN